MANSEDVLERAESWLRHDTKEPPAWLVARLAAEVRDLRDKLDSEASHRLSLCADNERFVAEVRELRAALNHSEGMQHGALLLKRIRDLRLQAIRDAVNQNKGDDLVRREVEWLLDCDASELDGFAALSARGGEGEAFASEKRVD